jgi:bacterioferritin
MKGDRQITDLLNQLLKSKLTSINQYFLHARIHDNWGLYEMGEKQYQASIRDMKHADKLIERLLFLETLPNLQDLDKLLIGENTEEILKNDLLMEQSCRKLLAQGIEICESGGDFVSRELLESLLEESESFIDWLETQLDLIPKVGLENYLQSMM